MNPRSHALISTPGAEETVGVGDAARSLKLAATKFSGSFDNWDVRDHELQFSYDVYENIGVVEVEGQLRSLDSQATLENVPAGEWEATVLIKFENNQCFRAEWRVGGGTNVECHADWSPQESNVTYDETSKAMEEATGVRPLLFRVDSDHFNCAGTKIIGSNKMKWVRLSLGVIRLKEPGDVTFAMSLVGNGWVRSIHFGDVELRAAGIGREKEKLLMMCLEGKASAEHCPLQELPTEMIRKVSRFLISPWHSTLVLDHGCE
mmetsp:Transcript_15244/g.20811  ORF Transcript_15244/g.20811 Transcript_15244/m.20811 type:complete len:262 (-) Transcript_15244:184-969(-)|eukprot:CAMPEP_0185732354 /NCGR_PEP_ID=MMETSP1171-20130828/15839_1 /TAXON_ID=374046 /ORGANISM="Helicotheca tamensis, Strain CCMP826" /LENGTH=261 /DNA_ID=CAMNT_0028401813 /DNA_START=191 /DNA_END=976 /DNA_ORIENTATION=+